jgi:hypothetical protein
MKLDKANCTYCGAPIKLTVNSEFINCAFCRNQMYFKNAISFSGSDLENKKEIIELRKNMTNFVYHNSYKEINRISGEIKNIIPEDPLANYYFAFSNYMMGEKSFLITFLNSNLSCSNKEIEEIVNHIGKYLDLSEKPRVEKFIKKHYIEYIDKLNYFFELRKKEEVNYQSLPKEAFVSYLDYDLDLVKEIVLNLEKNGISCWYAERNLRENQERKFIKQSITSAIQRSNIFILIASEFSTLAKDIQEHSEFAYLNKKVMIQIKINEKADSAFLGHYFSDSFTIKHFENEKTIQNLIEIIVSSKKTSNFSEDSNNNNKNSESLFDKIIRKTSKEIDNTGPQTQLFNELKVRWSEDVKNLYLRVHDYAKYFFNKYTTTAHIFLYIVANFEAISATNNIWDNKTLLLITKERLNYYGITGPKIGKSWSKVYPPVLNKNSKEIMLTTKFDEETLDFFRTATLNLISKNSNLQLSLKDVLTELFSNPNNSLSKILSEVSDSKEKIENVYKDVKEKLDNYSDDQYFKVYLDSLNKQGTNGVENTIKEDLKDKKCPSCGKSFNNENEICFNCEKINSYSSKIDFFKSKIKKSK